MEQVTVTYSTRANRVSGKPNEDYLLVDAELGVFVVCDGVTRGPTPHEYPVPSPATLAAEIFANATHKELAKLLPTDDIRRAIEIAIHYGNAQIAQFNQHAFPMVDYLENDFAGTVAIVCVLKGLVLHYGFIGDCGLLYFSGNLVQRITAPQTVPLNVYLKDNPGTKITWLEARKNIRNNQEHPLRFGVFTGETSALAFVEYGTVDLRRYEAIVLASDGLDPLWESETENVGVLSMEQLLDKTEKIEERLSLRSDDKTLIVLRR